MADITFKLKKDGKLPIEAESICPDRIAGKSIQEIGNLPVWKGNKELKLSELFDIEGIPGEDPAELVIRVDCNSVCIKRIGQEMSAGKIIIKGNAGMHVGQEMKGGEIVVEGDVDDWAFSQMKGGTAHVQGNAGHYLGAAEWGEWRGNAGGKITIDGNAKSEVGAWLSGGTIEIKGNVGEFLGIHMKKGAIIVHGTADARVGAQMTGGQILLYKNPISMLNGFKPSDETFDNIELNGNTFDGPFMQLIGDYAERKKPKGSIYIKK